MANVVVASMVRNEANRFLKRALRAWAIFADKIVVLDDESDDLTYQIAVSEAKTVVYQADWEEHAWGNENVARALLWQHALKESDPGDWIFVLDADMTPANDPRSVFSAATAQEADALAFKLFDLWKEDADGNLFYRTDRYWRFGPMQPRIWAVRHPFEQLEWQWPDRGIHCGHIPLNLPTTRVAVAGMPFSLLHYGYIHPDLREEKAERYTLTASQLSPFEQEHASSILTPATLMPLPFQAQLRLKRPSSVLQLIGEPDVEST